MALNIKDEGTEQAVRELARVTGESLTAAIGEAVRERLARVGGRNQGHDLEAKLEIIALRCAALPVLDTRPEDEILGYDGQGLPV